MFSSVDRSDVAVARSTGDDGGRQTSFGGAEERVQKDYKPHETYCIWID